MLMHTTRERPGVYTVIADGRTFWLTKIDGRWHITERRESGNVATLQSVGETGTKRDAMERIQTFVEGGDAA